MGCINEKYKVNGGFMQARTLAFSYDIAKDAMPSRGKHSIDEVKTRNNKTFRLINLPFYMISVLPDILK